MDDNLRVDKIAIPKDGVMYNVDHELVSTNEEEGRKKMFKEGDETYTAAITIIGLQPIKTRAE